MSGEVQCQCLSGCVQATHSTQHATCSSLRVGVGIAKGWGTVAQCEGASFPLAFIADCDTDAKRERGKKGREKRESDEAEGELRP